MHVAIVAMEVAPLAKVGGLADVTRGLARALASLGVRVSVMMPGYGHLSRDALDLETVAAVPGNVVCGGVREPVRLERGRLPGSDATLLLLRHDGFFDRPGIYADPGSGLEYDDALARYAYFCRAAAHALAALEHVDVLHLNDHHTALTAAYARRDVGVRDAFEHTGIVFSIHNLGYQGIYEHSVLPQLDLPQAWAAPGGPLEFWGRLNAMKLGLLLADVLTTVSPTYAREIQASAEQGFGLEGVLSERREVLFGILNGIDADLWNPATDPLLPARFDAQQMEGKAVCKRALQERLGLQPRADVPLFGTIGRFASQKGIDLLLQAAPELLERPLQLVLLGTGDPQLEAAARQLAASAPGRVAAHVGFDEELAHWIEAGCDYFLMPSRYEPCGLNQLYSQRYGCPPLVRRTGGLADTVSDWDPVRGRGTGFVFETMRVDALVHAVDRACGNFHHRSERSRLLRNAMAVECSWERAASQYLDAYRMAMARRSSRSSPRSGAGKPASIVSPRLGSRRAH